MAAFNREAALKSAEKALRLGRIDAAIAEYQAIVEAQPRDWNSANALGDLYVRAKQVDKGLSQYSRIADQLAAEGFFPKAQALYKKILKIKPDDEYALLQSGEIAAKQELLADAKSAFRAVADRRRARGDKKGAAELMIRVGALDPDDLDARLIGARAASEIGDTATALGEFREVAFKYDERGEHAPAFAAFQAAFDLDAEDVEIRGRLLSGYLTAGTLDRARAVAQTPDELKQVAAAYEGAGQAELQLEVLGQAAQLDPDDLIVRAQLGRAHVARGDMAKAREFLDPRTAGQSAPLWLTLAEVELVTGRLDDGRAAVATALSLDIGARAAAVQLGSRLAVTAPDAGYTAVDAVADAAVARHDYAGAAAALQEFAGKVRHHVIALVRLVEICVDGGLETTLHDAQAQLADAYLEVGRGLEARIISEDLVAREPWATAHVERFRRALIMLGEPDPDAIIADRLSGDSPFLATDKLDLNEGVFFDEPEPAGEATPLPAAAPMPVVEPPVQQAASEALAATFTEKREEVAKSPEEEAAAEQYRLAVTYRELGMVEDAIEVLQTAVKSPRLRFEAGAMLGALHLELDDVDAAIEAFDAAAAAPAPTPEEGRGLLYDLASALERSGDLTRALGVFAELQAESGSFRDVAARIKQISKAQLKG